MLFLLGQVAAAQHGECSESGTKLQFVLSWANTALPSVCDSRLGALTSSPLHCLVLPHAVSVEVYHTDMQDELNV